MYWLLEESKQREIRKIVRDLTMELSTIIGNPQTDQLFPYVGRKDRRKAEAIVKHLSPEAGTVCDPFSGSGIHAYAITTLQRKLLANEWEPYVNRISAAPWRLPEESELKDAYKILLTKIKLKLDDLYRTKCPCGKEHVLHTLFFDRIPLRYIDVEIHERLGTNGETITYRGKHKCANCGRTEKTFDEFDAQHIERIQRLPVDPIFEFGLIENSRINLSRDFTTYGSLFPHRSKLALKIIWDTIQNLDCNVPVKFFLEDVFLSILPQAKYKDYRSKSQDLHCPTIKLREVNLLYVYKDQFQKRLKGLQRYSFVQTATNNFIKNPIKKLDFRDFLDSLGNNSIDLVFTDPPWTDGTAYFERAQLYHPWLDYDLKTDTERLAKEMVVTDAPSRKSEHSMERWWADLEELFLKTYRVLDSNKFMALFFRPIPAGKWLTNLNHIKLIARKTGFEPLLSIDVGSSDPSMRIQQSASYVFSKDVVILFLRLDSNLRREFFRDHDLDQYVYQTAVELQEEGSSPFFYSGWRKAFSERLELLNISQIDSPKEEDRIWRLFNRYCDEVSPHMYLPKIQTPFSSQLFDTPAIERLFTYVPQIIDELTRNGRIFTYDQFLLGLAEFVENGTRELINSIEKIDMRAMIETYAEPLNEGLNFRRRPLPQLPEGLTNVIALDPSDFEVFVARLLEAQGYTSLALIGRAGDRGVDVTGVDPQGRATVVQCKRYIRNNVSATPIQRLHSFAITRGAERKIMVATSDFTLQAIEEAANTGTELVNGEELETLIATYMPNYFDANN